MKKCLSTLLSVMLLACMIFSAGAAASGGDCVIDDRAHLLSDEAAVEEMALKVYEVTGVRAAFASVDGAGMELYDYAESFYEDNIPCKDSVLLVVDAEEQSFLYYLTGTARELYEDEYWDVLCDAYREPATYQEGVEDYLDALYTILTGQELDAAMDFVPVEREKSLVVDEAGVLTVKQLASLNEKADAIAETCEMEVALVFVSTLDGRSARDYADDYYDYNGYGYGPDDDGILLLVAVEDREYWITCHAAGVREFDEYAQESLADAFVPYMSENDWYGAAGAYLEQAEKEMDHTVSLIWIPLSVGLGMLIALLPMLQLKKQLKPVAKKQEANQYISYANLSVKQDQFLHTTVTRRKIETESSSGGGSTHTSSSGRSHSGSGGRF